MKDIETDLARSGGELLLGLMENHKKDLSRWIRQGVDNVRVSLGFYLREKALEGNYTEQFLDKLLEEAQRAVKSDQMKQIITNKLENWEKIGSADFWKGSFIALQSLQIP